MCQLKSCLVLKDRVFCPDYNSHQSMLEELGIEDNYLHADKTFVRVEFTPPNNKSLIEPLDRWTLKVDQDVIPEWWDEKADRQRVEEAVETWRKMGHPVTESTWNMTSSRDELSKEAENMSSEGHHLLFTHLTGGNHRATWFVAYGIPDVQDWLFKQHR